MSNPPKSKTTTLLNCEIKSGRTARILLVIPNFCSSFIESTRWLDHNEKKSFSEPDAFKVSICSIPFVAMLNVVCCFLNND